MSTVHTPDRPHVHPPSGAGRPETRLARRALTASAMLMCAVRHRHYPRQPRHGGH